MTLYLPSQLLPLVQATGRWVIKKIKGQAVLYTTNLGSSIRLVITGTRAVQISVCNNGHPGFPRQVYAWRYDQHPWRRFPAQEGPVDLPLPDRHAHVIEIMTAGNTDLDEVWSGNEGFAIQSLTTGKDGRLAAAPSRPVVDFIGDSITAGCWVAGKHAARDYRPESNYVGIASDHLGINGVRIAYSAAGVLRPGTGGVPPAQGFLNQVDATTPWQTNRPQAVVVNLGVNDRRFPPDQFVPAYDHLLDQVTALFPASRILVLTPFSQSFQKQVSQLAADHQLQLVNTTGWCTGFTDGLHPNQAGSLAAAKQFATVLAAVLDKN